jgi:hypothetical protein
MGMGVGGGGAPPAASQNITKTNFTFNFIHFIMIY